MLFETLLEQDVNRYRGSDVVEGEYFKLLTIISVIV